MPAYMTPIFIALLFGLLVAAGFGFSAKADCGDCGMSNHEYYGGK